MMTSGTITTSNPARSSASCTAVTSSGLDMTLMAREGDRAQYPL
jgi:hypothetical protein